MKGQTDASDFRVNKIEALVVPNSKFVFRGGKYSARIVLSAVDSTKRPDYYINGSKLASEMYELTAGSRMGINKYSGEIKLPGNDGTVRSYPFESEYIVSEPSATISNIDLNVVYRGIDNNFSISVPGVANENVQVSAVGATVQNKGAGRYVINPTRDGEISISVIGKIDNKPMNMGGGTYRVKPLPKPTAFLVDASGNQITSGSMSVEKLKGMKLFAGYEEGEVIKANFQIKSFVMIGEGAGVSNVNGSNLDPNLLSRMRIDKNLIFNNIVAVGPDGKSRVLNVIFVKIM